MPITAEQLEALAAGIYGEAEKHFRADGKVVPALWFIPDSNSGTARLVAMPNGIIDREQTAQIARTDRPAAILLTGEYWIGSATVPASTVARLALDDLPRPSEQTDRREVIATRAVGRAPDGGLLHAMRTTLILRSVFGAQLLPFDLDPDADRNDDYAASLAGLIPRLPNRRGRRRH